MSYSEIIEQVDRLTPGEREQLAAHLRVRTLLDDPGYMEEMDRREEEMERGVNCLTREQLLDRLRQHGRAVLNQAP